MEIINQQRAEELMSAYEEVMEESIDPTRYHRLTPFFDELMCALLTLYDEAEWQFQAEQRRILDSLDPITRAKLEFCGSLE